MGWYMLNRVASEGGVPYSRVTVRLARDRLDGDFLADFH